MRVDNVRVYDLAESLVASGYPMRTSTPIEVDDYDEKDLVRGSKLSAAANKNNPAHAQFLTGIRVAFDLTLTNKAWVEAERYRFLEFVSSQSTMHRITRFDLRKQYNEYVDPRVINIMVDKVQQYNNLLERLESNKSDHEWYEEKMEELKHLRLEILYTNPSGFEITARMTTNYRCLKNIYIQRKDHALPEWREFCSWIETLPYFNELINPNN
jgi:hypothetical protein